MGQRSSGLNLSGILVLTSMILGGLRACNTRCQPWRLKPCLSFPNRRFSWASIERSREEFRARQSVASGLRSQISGVARSRTEILSPLCNCHKSQMASQNPESDLDKYKQGHHHHGPRHNVSLSNRLPYSANTVLEPVRGRRYIDFLIYRLVTSLWVTFRV